MDLAIIKKARVLLSAGVDDATIASTLNISLNDLEKIKSGEVAETRPAPLKNGENGRYISKVTEEYFNDMKARIEAKPQVITVNEFCRANDVSLPTYYRIKAAKNIDDYRSMTSANVTKMPKGYTAPKPVAYRARNSYNEATKIIKNEDDFFRLKDEIANRTMTVDDFCLVHHFSKATYYQIDKANTYEEYVEARKEAQAKHAEYKRKKREELRANRLSLREAVKIVEPYAIPKEEPKNAETNAERREKRKEDYLLSKELEEPKKEPTQIEVLERIATQLERLADYEQMKLSKKGWFRRANK